MRITAYAETGPRQHVRGIARHPRCLVGNGEPGFALADACGICGGREAPVCGCDGVAPTRWPLLRRHLNARKPPPRPRGHISAGARGGV